MCSFSIFSLSSTEMLMGTFCRFSTFFCAVTTISSRAPELASVSVAACAGIPAERIAEIAEASGA